MMTVHRASLVAYAIVGMLGCGGKNSGDSSTPLSPTAVNTATPDSFFSYTSDTGAPIQSERLTPSNARLDAYCNRSIVLGSATSVDGRSDWTFQFGAPDGQPLKPGTYDSGGVDLRSNNMTVFSSKDSTACRPAGRFMVHEAEFDFFGDVRRLRVTFEQSCQGRAGAVRGEVNLTTPGKRADRPPSNCILP